MFLNMQQASEDHRLQLNAEVGPQKQQIQAGHFGCVLRYGTWQAKIHPQRRYGQVLAAASKQDQLIFSAKVEKNFATRERKTWKS